jgi:beta-lactamase regulating signal transducer with metallopeptidase domain
MNILIDTALKGSLLIAAAAVASYFLRGRSAAARHAAWTAAVIGHLALPALSMMMPEWKLPILPAPAWIEAPAATAPASRNEVEPASTGTPVRETENAAPVTPAAAPVTTSTEKPSLWSSIQGEVSAMNLSPIALLWIAGAAIVLLRLALGTWKVGRLARQGDRVDDGEWLSLTQRLANRLGITRPLTLLRGDKLAVPVTWGVVYPAVLLPPDSTDWPEERRRFVLVHEMAHVKRFDALTQLLAQIAIAIFWFDPLIWLAAHRMRVEREHACDDYVIRDGTKPSLYAGELLEMVQSIGTPARESAAPAFAALAMARRSEFEGRMLAILDSRQDRHTLSRASALAATAALALLVLPLAALKPFGPRAEDTVVKPADAGKSTNQMDAASLIHISANACDSVIRTASHSSSTHLHIDDGDGGGTPVIEYMGSSVNRCAQAAIVGESQFSDDRLISLGSNAYATITEVTSSSNRTVHITRRPNGTLEFTSRLNGALTPFDDTMRSWLGRLLPEVLREAAVDAPQRVARDLAHGGVTAVLTRIATIRSPASRRAHYEALLDGRPLTSAEYDRVARHASQQLASSPSDLKVVLERVAAGPAKGTRSLGGAVATLGRAQDALDNALDAALGKGRTSSDTAQTLTQYGVSDDPDMLLLALRGAKDVASEGQRRVLLQTLAAGALRRGESKFRSAWFDAASTITSDGDMRVALQSALPYGHNDPLITTIVLKLVAENISSDADKRVVLVTALEQRLIKSSRQRTEFMTAANTISSDIEMAVVLAAAAKQ